MTDLASPPQAPLIDGLLLIVVGANLSAEFHDRPTAESLRTNLIQRLADPARDDPAQPLNPLVCTDIWYLNNDELRRRPTISVGAPDVNALTAHLASRLPSALAVDGRYMIHLDLECIEPLAACWGSTHAETSTAVTAFVTRFAHGFLETALRR